MKLAEELNKIRQFDLVLLKAIVSLGNPSTKDLIQEIKRLHKAYGFRAPSRPFYTMRLQYLERLGLIKRARSQINVYSIEDDFRFCVLNLTGAYFEIWGKLKGGVLHESNAK